MSYHFFYYFELSGAPLSKWVTRCLLFATLLTAVTAAPGLFNHSRPILSNSGNSTEEGFPVLRQGGGTRWVMPETAIVDNII